MAIIKKLQFSNSQLEREVHILLQKIQKESLNQGNTK